MMYYKVKDDGTLDNDSKVTVEGFLEIFNSTVFPVTEDGKIPEFFLEEQGWVGIEAVEMPKDLQETADLMWTDEPVKGEDGKWTRDIRLIPVPEDKREERIKRKFNAIIAERNRLLDLTDHTQSSDYPYAKEYQEYRQKLRDLPASNSDPFLIKFPDVPDVDKLKETSFDTYLKWDEATETHKYDETKIEQFRTNKLTYLTASYDKLRARSYIIVPNIGKIDTGDKYLTNMDVLIDVLEEDNESTTQFRMEDNSYKEVSLDELKQLRSYIKRAGIVLTKLKWAKEEAIKNAKTFEELIACPHEISEEDISNVLFPPVEETAAPKKATKKKAKATEA